MVFLPNVLLWLHDFFFLILVGISIPTAWLKDVRTKIQTHSHKGIEMMLERQFAMYGCMLLGGLCSLVMWSSLSLFSYSAENLKGNWIHPSHRPKNELLCPAEQCVLEYIVLHVFMCVCLGHWCQNCLQSKLCFIGPLFPFGCASPEYSAVISCCWCSCWCCCHGEVGVAFSASSVKQMVVDFSAGNTKRYNFLPTD